ncbi:hypothetical protein KAFR_0A05320 [Kazachstania africana CBS 2517]|uniref:TFIIS N-terminal domain-containing protein n=1 Tax=Kazachstania africana (strain ATCC 22294 / BCRC 22015 / CBS 2517 / CECT 1963 / NBRC 1671 / NRRL Y-8276) TaxID=1071382 RepID=H2ANL7_KAZAF|nr:hypothetical protein KAFR_0A05320 [Kazachstania africana CBS 2517]CCF55967.1 hypothetical protein KAFR_0A05320 [Kazachstania africana CBS 2517]
MDPDHSININNTSNVVEEAQINEIQTPSVEPITFDNNGNEPAVQDGDHHASKSNTEENDVVVDRAIIDNIPVEDDAPVERKRKHIASGNDSEEDSEEENNQVDTTPEVDTGRPMTKRQELEDRLDRLLKKPKVRRSRRDEDDLEQYLDEKILRLKDEMNIAAQMDIETLNKRIETGNTSLIAIQKVRLLPKVESILSKANLADTILDNNLLQSVRIWLEPLPDGSLPSFEIQKSLFAAIKDLPIKTEHLKESGLGRVMIFYTKSKRVEPQLSRMADRLIAEWTRPIIGASDNYRDLRITKLEFDYERSRKKSALDSAISRKRKLNKTNSATGERSNTQTLYEQAAARRNRAAAPAQTTTDYKYAPVSNLSAIQNNARTTGVGSTLTNNDMYKRLNASLHKNKKK